MDKVGREFRPKVGNRLDMNGHEWLRSFVVWLGARGSEKSERKNMEQYLHRGTA